jgi:hypothetical protein
MNRVQLLKVVTTCAVLAIPDASNAGPTPGRTLQDPIVAGTTIRSQDIGGHSTPRHSARVYLDQAKAILDAVPDANLDRDGKKLMSALRHDFSALTDFYLARQEERTPVEGNAATANWQARFSDVERRLAEIVGAGSSYSPSYAASGTLASSAADTTAVPAAQRKAASSPASSTLVAPITSPATTVVGPAVPAGAVAPGSAPATVLGQPAFTTTPPAAPSNLPQNPAVAAAAANAAATTPTGAPPVPGVTDAGAPGVNAAGAGITPTTLASQAGPVVGTTGAGAAAVAGVLISTIGLKNLDLGVRMQLEQFRTAVELFFDATTRVTS